MLNLCTFLFLNDSQFAFFTFTYQNYQSYLVMPMACDSKAAACDDLSVRLFLRQAKGVIQPVPYGAVAVPDLYEAVVKHQAEQIQQVGQRFVFIPAITNNVRNCLAVMCVHLTKKLRRLKTVLGVPALGRVQLKCFWRVQSIALA